MAIDKIISTDSHIVEPPDLWEKRIDPKFRDRAPRLVWTGTTDQWFIDKDTPTGPGGEVISEAGKRYTDPDSMSIDSRFEGVRPGAYDPHPRLKDLETDGVIGEVVIPTVPTRFYSLNLDSDLLSACFRAMNDFMADFCKPYPDIFKGLGMLNLRDVQEGLKEYDRCLKMGLSGIMIPVIQEENRLYDQPEYEPLWARAQESGVPIVIHSGTDTGGPGRMSVFAQTAFGAAGAAAMSGIGDHWVRRSIGNMIFGGVFKRYPGLKILVVEFEMGWAPHWLKRMDVRYSELRYTKEINFPDNKVPSDYWHSNVTINFMEDDIGIAYRDIIGVDNIVYGSDYPHRESTWPRSRETLAELLEGIPEEEQTKISYSNAAKLFNFSV